MDFTTGMPPVLLNDLLARAASLWPDRQALTHAGQGLAYAELQAQVLGFAQDLRRLGVVRGARVAVYLEKRSEWVVAVFGAVAAGCVMVPVNPLLKPSQVQHILQDCAVSVLVTSRARLGQLADVPKACPALQHAVVCDERVDASVGECAGGACPIPIHPWLTGGLRAGGSDPAPLALETDVVGIFYTSGSTGRPKGVVLSHRNLVAGASSVVSYLGQRADDVVVAALPLSFDAGFSQLTTAFWVGARVVLHNYLLPRDLLDVMARERVTGITAVPPLYMQLLAHEWPADIKRHLRYWANTGGRMPAQTLQRLRDLVPQARPFLMYGLTEAFRSTYLPPECVDRCPASIGRAIPNVEIFVLREDGRPCDVNEPGELVHRGPLVSLGYWNRPNETAERFRALPPGLVPGRDGVVCDERVVFSGDVVRRDAEGLLYFVGRRDEMIKTSGYRISPTEIEEVVYASACVDEAVAVGVPHETLGQVVHVIARAPTALTAGMEQEGESGSLTSRLLAHCRQHLPAYMVPVHVVWSSVPLPRNPNGKLDRQHWKNLHGQF